MKLTSFLLPLALAALPQAQAAFSSAEPLVVHEWGVNAFDWQGDPDFTMHDADLPPFFYTDKNPGEQFNAIKKVKDLPPDRGIRFKPLLYFYGNAPVGLEVKFKYGYANAWYPQVNSYRDAEMVKNAKPIDWAAWQKKEQRINLQQKKLSMVPDDPTFELVWHDLKVSKSSPLELNVIADEDHWVNIAREVDASTVSNGKQHEKFVFYEGATTEVPAITILPTETSDNFTLINNQEFPIYDVFIIYREGDKKYVKYHSEIKVGDKGVSFPNFSKGKWQQLTDKEFTEKTTSQLVATLMKPRANDLPAPVQDKETRSKKPFMMRDPADRQGAALSHTLYEKEAVGLEKIWREDFFEQSGLTIVYREAPAYLDDAMPLNIYTDMYHYIQLNRCGLVCNNNINLENIKAAYEVAPKVLTGRMIEEDKKFFLNNKLLVKTYLQHLCQ